MCDGPDNALAETQGRSGRSAPNSPCMQKKSSAGPSGDSRIPRPSSLISSTPLHRSGSLRLRGEKTVFPNGKNREGFIFSPRGSPGIFPSITEGTESWKKSLRTPCGDGFGLRRQHHHRSLQSLTSAAAAPHPLSPTPSPEESHSSRPHNLNRILLDRPRDFLGDRDDLDSLRSYGSNCSTQSACDHAHFGRNGTTFSGRRMKYIVHCSSPTEPEEYLTPTQRSNQQIRRLKALLEQSRKDLEVKDENIFKLTKEVVELRLLRDEVDGNIAGGTPANVEVSPRTTGNGEISCIDKVTCNSDNDFGTPASLSDSGHFDDLLSSLSVHSQHSPGPRKIASSNECERLAESYQRRIDEMVRRHNEKSTEDRKSLVEMYEKKMEEMSRKLTEKEKIERKSLLEMYDQKIEDIIKVQSEKHAEEQKTIVNESERKVDRIMKDIEEEKASLVTKYENAIKRLVSEQEDMYLDWKSSQKKEAKSIQEVLLEQTSRCNDHQQEVFQARERIVQLEEEIEILQRTLKQQETSQKEFEVQVLRKYAEEQEKFRIELQEALDIKAQLEDEVKLLKNTAEKVESHLQSAEWWKLQSSEYERELKSLKETVTAQISDLEQSKKCAAALGNEVELLKRKLCEQANSHKEYLDHLQNHHESILTSKQEELINCQQRIANLESECLVLNELKQLCSDLEFEIDKLRHLLEESSSERNSQKDQIEFLQHSICQKDDELLLNSKIITGREEEIGLLRDKLFKSIETKKELMICKKTLEEEQAILRVQLAEVEASRKLAIHEKEREVSQARLEVATLRAQIKKDNDELNIEKYSKLQEEVSCLQTKIMECEGENRDIKISYRKLKEEQEDVERFKSEMSTLMQLIAHDKQMIVESNSENFSLKAEIDSLKQMISLKEKEIVTSLQKTSQLEEKDGSLKKNVSECEEENRRLLNAKESFSEEQACPKEETSCVKNHECDAGNAASSQYLSSDPRGSLAERETATVSVLKEKCASDEGEANETETVTKLLEEVNSLERVISEQDKQLSDLSLKMYLRGQEAANFEHRDKVLEVAAHAPEKVSVPELLYQLSETEKELEKVKDDPLSKMPNVNQCLLSANEAVLLYLLGSLKAMYRRLAEGQANNSSSPEATLLFLKSAFYYFLTDEANCQGHLHAIQSILGFTESEKRSIDTLTYLRR